MRTILAMLIVLLITINLSVIAVSADDQNVRVIVYGFGLCGSCRDFMKFLDKNNIPYRHYDLINESRAREFDYLRNELAKLLNINKNDVVEPLSIIYDRNGYPVGVIVGDIEDIDFIYMLLRSEYNGSVLVRLDNSIRTIHSSSFINYLCTIYSSSSTGNSETIDLSIPGFLTLMLGLAVADSINPCAISTTLMLVITAVSMGFIGRRKYLPVASFIAGVYLGYLLLGFLVSYIISLFNVLLLIVLGLALAIIIKDVIDLIKGKYNGIECTDRECLPSFISKLPIHVVPIALAGFGMIISWTFMSCSAAPYFIFLSYITLYVKDMLLRSLYMMIYCFIIILPLVIVTFLPIEKVLGLRKIGRIILIKDILLTIIVIYIVYNILLSLGII